MPRRKRLLLATEFIEGWMRPGEHCTEITWKVWSDGVCDIKIAYNFNRTQKFPPNTMQVRMSPEELLRLTEAADLSWTKTEPLKKKEGMRWSFTRFADGSRKEKKFGVPNPKFIIGKSNFEKLVEALPIIPRELLTRSDPYQEPIHLELTEE